MSLSFFPFLFIPSIQIETPTSYWTTAILLIIILVINIMKNNNINLIIFLNKPDSNYTNSLPALYSPSLSALLPIKYKSPRPDDQTVCISGPLFALQIKIFMRIRDEYGTNNE